jgi:hypothetical protein
MCCRQTPFHLAVVCSFPSHLAYGLSPHALVDFDTNLHYDSCDTIFEELKVESFPRSTLCDHMSSADFRKAGIWRSQ